jgi:predicted CXXCH cytochrome family protein
MQDASAEGAIVADMNGAPIAQGDIKYVLAGNRKYQAYIDNNLKVMSHRWIVAEKKWAAEPDAGKDAATQCIGCHTTGYNPATKEFNQLGVGCEMCHGPGSVHAAKLGKEPMVKPEELDPQHRAMICGQCHSVGQSKDGTCAFPVGFKPGGNLPDYFVDSGTQEAVRNSQYTHLLQSPKHLGQGTICTTCHDPHGDTDQPHQLKKPITELCLSCHSDKVKDIASHAAEKQVQAPADATCATCHMKDGVHLFDKAVAGQ